MTTCLKYLVPISCFLFLGAAVWPLALAYLAGGETTWLPKRPLGDSVPRRVVGSTAEVTVVPHFGTPENGSTRQLTLAARQSDSLPTRKIHKIELGDSVSGRAAQRDSARGDASQGAWP
jgi:NADH-quinone oxidoreductase subunit H